MNRLVKAVAAAPDLERQSSRQDQADLAAYIAEMTGELAQLAGEAGMPMLAYFLNLARVEAQITVRENDLREPRRGL